MDPRRARRGDERRRQHARAQRSAAPGGARARQRDRHARPTRHTSCGSIPTRSTRGAGERLRELEAEVSDAADFHLETRIADVPILWDDPWTAETVKRFADRRRRRARRTSSSPRSSTAPVDRRVRDAGLRHAVSRPRSSGSSRARLGASGSCPRIARSRCPVRAPAHGHARARLLVGRPSRPCTPCAGPRLPADRHVRVAVLRRAPRLPDFLDRDWFFRAGDVMRYRPVDRAEFDRVRAAVEDGLFRYRVAEVEFVPGRWYDDPDGTTAAMEGAWMALDRQARPADDRAGRGASGSTRRCRRRRDERLLPGWRTCSSATRTARGARDRPPRAERSRSATTRSSR